MSGHAWWNRPVWPSTAVITPRERLARWRAAAGRTRHALGSTQALVTYAVAGALALAAAVLGTGFGLARPGALWLGASAVVTVATGLLLGRARSGRGRLAGLPAAAAPAVALALATALVGVPWALAGRTSAGPVRALAAGLPWAIDGATQVGQRVALAATDGDDGTVTMLDLRTGDAMTAHLGAQVSQLSAVGDDVLVTTTDGLVLLDPDGAELWRVAGDAVRGPFPVAADDDVVVMADSAGPGENATGDVVALRRDGTVAWRAGGTSAFGALTAGGVGEYGSSLPPVAVITTAGGHAVVDPRSGVVLHESTLLPVAAVGDMVLWEGRPVDGTCGVTATRGDRTAWQATLPCPDYSWSVREDTLLYAHLDGPGYEPVGMSLDLATGTATPLDAALIAYEDGIAIASSGPDAPMSGRLVGTDASGDQRWALPAAPWRVGEMWVQTGRGTVAAATRPLTVNPLASLRTPHQVTVLDPRTGSVAGWLRCRTGAMGGIPLDQGRALALCAEPTGTLEAWLVG